MTPRPTERTTPTRTGEHGGRRVGRDRLPILTWWIGATLLIVTAFLPCGARALANDEFRWEAVRAALRDGRFAEVVSILQPLLATLPPGADADDAERLLAHAYFELGDLATARAHFARLLLRAPPQLEFLTQLARIDAERGRRGTALDALRLAAVIEPTHRGLALWLADVALTVGAAGEAEARLEQWIEHSPADAEAFVRWGEVAERLGRTAAARARYRTAYHLGRRTPALAERLGRLAMADSDPESAAEWFERAAALAGWDPADILAGRGAILAYECAVAWHVAGQSERALARLDDALTAGLPTPTRALAQWLRGRIAVEHGHEEIALEAWTLVLDSTAETAEVVTFLAEAYTRRGRLAEAEACLNRPIVSQHPTRAVLGLRVRCAIARAQVPAVDRALADYVARFGWDATAAALLDEARNAGI